MIVYLKTPEEIEGFRKAGKIAADILSKLLERVKIKATTQELNQFAIQECERQKVRPVFLGYEKFPAAICASPNDVLVHGVPNGKPLTSSDIISIDIGIELNGFIGDTAETYTLGAQSEGLIRACREALDESIKVAKPGNTLKDIAEAVTRVANKHRYNIPQKFGGHGINPYELHGDPFVANNPDEAENLRLRPGMVIAIEPMLIQGDPQTTILQDGWTVLTGGPSAHCEHTVLITAYGPEVLTKR